MKKVLVILSFMVLFSCRKEPQPFYEFDTVDYYHVDINQVERLALFNRKDNPEKMIRPFGIFFLKIWLPKLLKTKNLLPI